jgi:hypothetical protein
LPLCSNNPNEVRPCSSLGPGRPAQAERRGRGGEAEAAAGAAGFGTNLMAHMTLFQQAHAALKKKYDKDK